MFEKDAEEISKDIYIHHFDDDVNYPDVLKAIIVGVKKGVEFGYNKGFKEGLKQKVNITTISDCPIKDEWHYVKDGEYPKDEKNFQSYVVAYYGAKGSIANGKPCWEELCYDTENKRWVDKETLDDIPYVNREGIVIAWKEIVLPELKESE